MHRHSAHRYFKGMYPTAVILLVQLTDNCAHKALSLSDMPTLPLQRSQTENKPATGTHGLGGLAVWMRERGYAEGSDRSSSDIQ